MASFPISPSQHPSPSYPFPSLTTKRGYPNLSLIPILSLTPFYQPSFLSFTKHYYQSLCLLFPSSQISFLSLTSQTIPSHFLNTDFILHIPSLRQCKSLASSSLHPLQHPTFSYLLRYLFIPFLQRSLQRPHTFPSSSSRYLQHPSLRLSLPLLCSIPPLPTRLSQLLCCLYFLHCPSYSFP